MPDDVQTTGFSIVNIGFPPGYTKAIRDKQVAREQAETERFVLERQRLTSTHPCRAGWDRHGFSLPGSSPPRF
jgi:hypothetical protein